jgi:hypothetical protein
MMLRRSLALVVALAVPSLARAQSGEPARPAGSSEVNPVGEYSGVDGPESGARVAVGKPGKQPRLFWIGFQAREGGGARLFIQLDREVAASQTIEGGKLYISLGQVRPVARNSLRWLDTRFFDSSVARIDPGAGKRGKKKRGGGLTIAVSFKDGSAPVEGTMSSSQGKDGLTYLSFDFPAGK